jgi:pimeloyl-ACP methyl ester carboxylesterase/membrane protein DedA with SNARE-associated domain
MSPRIRHCPFWLLVIYLLLLLASHQTSRGSASENPLPPAMKAVEVDLVQGEASLSQRISLAYRDLSAAQTSEPPIVLLHGSPGKSDDFNRLAPLLADRFRLIIPDLPGFGHSTHQIPDYSIRAHARYLLQLLDALKIQRAHFVGFSMGGGVVLNLVDLAPDRVVSVTMLSAIGVQEMELLGDYHLNHIIHGVQLGGLWALFNLVPHFGYLDDAMMDIPYARNFYDSDQRPLRGLLLRLQQPMLIIHGREDFLAPVEVAEEHHRLVPQSELCVMERDHFMVFMMPQMLAPIISDFIDRVDSDRALNRDQADSARVTASLAPLDSRRLPKAIGVTAIVIFLLLATATLVSEDLTCIAAGLMAGQGRISLTLAIVSCLFGIFVGDLMLFLAGRFLGRPAIRAVPLKWFIKPEAVEHSSAWFSQRGAAVIFISRFVPGMRLPTYFAAGVLRTSFIRFSFYFFLACLLWTPLLVGLSMLLGGELVKSIFVDHQSYLLGMILVAVGIFLLLRFLLRLTTWHGRRMLVSRWRRLTRWEFWPAWVFYIPVVSYVASLMFRFRSLTLFTLANPAIPGGGFVGESKAHILDNLKTAGEFVAPSRLIPAQSTIPERWRAALDFVDERGGKYPVVVKPDAGQRGSGVVIARDTAQLKQALERAEVDVLVQEFADGDEFGVFYYRYPNDRRGEILAITEKRFPVVTGDGRKNLEELILGDERAVCMAKFFLDTHRQRLHWIPAKEEHVQLVELGTHCRGAIFLDGGWVKTEGLEESIDRIARTFEGFYFGRFDIRVPSIEGLKAGTGYRVIELNGVTSEATSIYDPRNRLRSAYRLLFRQWRIAFEIGDWHRKRGLKPTPLRDLIKWTRDYQRQSQAHFNSADLEAEREQSRLKV